MGRHDTFLGARWAPSRFRRVLRNRLVQALAVLGIGVSAAIALVSAEAALKAERAQWGTTIDVVTITDRVDAGELIADATEFTSLPIALVPAGAATAVLDDARAKVALYPGEVLLAERITGEVTTNATAGTVAMGATVISPVSLITEGDLVDLWTADSANLVSKRVAHAVVVLAINDDDITVAVPEESVADLVVASLRPLTVTLVG